MEDNAVFETEHLTALVGSRLCHDLINPLGAIGNGVELLGMTPGTMKPELSLISDAVRDAQSRIRFFRIAFGHADASSTIGRREIDEIITGLYGNGGRLSAEWQSAGDMLRRDVKIGLLMISCCEAAMPLGGLIKITETDGTFRLEAEARRLNIDPELWSIVRGSTPMRPIRPAEVQFLLFAQEALRQDRILQVEIGENSILMTG